jgi:hypothetical protein
MLTLRRLVMEDNGLYTPAPADLPVLRYYASAIEHLLPAPTADASFG